jgi:hypothetical protein
MRSSRAPGTPRLDAAGSTLPEALAALVLVAAAAAVVAAGAAVGLRGVHQASRIEEALAVASGELSALQSHRPIAVEETRRDQPSLGPSATSATSVALTGGVVTLAVAVRVAADVPPIALETRMAAPQ